MSRLLISLIFPLRIAAAAQVSLFHFTIILNTKWRFITLVLILLYSGNIRSQTNDKILSQQEFISLVLMYHPMAKQADIIAEQGKAELTVARGGFDPTIQADFIRKSFDGTNYFSLFESELKIPAWFADVKAGYDYYYGSFINPENKIPAEGQSFAGISLPLLRDLITDKKRTALRQARLFRDASVQERILMLNDLLFDAIQAYYEWLYDYNSVKVYENAVKLAQDRLEFTRKSVIFGDRPAIDTVEALTQLQLRLYELNDARTNLRNALLNLSNYMWTESGVPLVFDSTISPAPIPNDWLEQSITMQQAEELVANARSSHPLVLFYNYKLLYAKAERLLKAQSILPRLNASYFLLSREIDFYRNPEFTAMRNNYKLGLSFSMPLSFTFKRV
ncbi:MAG: TolC family protein [Chitinophagales bacterium]|nr:TolC family protein [Chitinophagales bacterium]